MPRKRKDKVRKGEWDFVWGKKARNKGNWSNMDFDS